MDWNQCKYEHRICCHIITFLSCEKKLAKEGYMLRIRACHPQRIYNAFTVVLFTYLTEPINESNTHESYKYFLIHAAVSLNAPSFPAFTLGSL